MIKKKETGKKRREKRERWERERERRSREGRGERREKRPFEKDPVGSFKKYSKVQGGGSFNKSMVIIIYSILVGPI